MNAGSPYRLVVLTLVMVSACQRPAVPHGQAVARAEDVKLGERLDEQLKIYEQQGFSGSVLAAVGGNLVLVAGYGLADREKKIFLVIHLLMFACFVLARRTSS